MQIDRKEQCLHWKRKPFPELVRLAWPIVASLVSYSVMTLVDTLFVARLGATSLAAVGLGAMGVFSVLCFGIGVFAGAKVRVSRVVGAGRDGDRAVLLGAFLRLSVVLGVLTSAAALLVAHCLPWVSADASVGLQAREYAAVRGFGVLLALPTAAIAQYRQAVGDSKTAMRAALWANAANIPLNAVFLFVLDWGTLGAAVATLLASGIELALLLLRQSASGLCWECATWSDAHAVFRFGLPTGIERWLDVGAFAALVALLGRMGPVEVAAHQVALQIVHFAFLPMLALGEAVSVLVAQAFGSREPALARRVLGHALWIGIGFGLVLGMLLSGAAQPLIGLFTHDPDVRLAGARVLHYAALLQLLNGAYAVLKGALRGAGLLGPVAWVAVACAWVFTPPLTLFFGIALGWGAAGGWVALCVEVAAGLVALSVISTTRSVFGTDASRVNALQKPA